MVFTRKKSPYTTLNIGKDRIEEVEEIKISTPQRYRFDFKKVKTFDDIKLILEAMDLSFDDSFKNFNNVKHISKKI